MDLVLVDGWQEAEGQLSLAHSHEIATLALYEKDLPLARKYALKAIHADKTHIPSYKVRTQYATRACEMHMTPANAASTHGAARGGTLPCRRLARQTLVRVIQQTGESTHAEEELAFSFFVQLLHDSRQAEDYYRYMQEHWPRAYFALAYQGLFLSEVKAKLAAKPQDRDICLHEAEHAFRQATRILAAKGIFIYTSSPREAAHTHHAHVSSSLTHSLTHIAHSHDRRQAGCQGRVDSGQLRHVPLPAPVRARRGRS